MENTTYPFNIIMSNADSIQIINITKVERKEDEKVKSWLQ
jgi:hypothetical protein